MSFVLKKITLVLVALLLFSCTPNQTSSSDDDDPVVVVTTGGEDDPDDNTVITDPNCTGTSTDGTGEGPPIYKMNLFLAGHQSWVPGNYTDPLALQTNISIVEASKMFQSDARVRVRLRVKSQPYPTAGDIYCLGRQTGRVGDSHPYTKLRFAIHLRDILCEVPDPNDLTKCNSGFYLGTRYRTQFIDPVNVDSCSPIIDIGSLRNQTVYGTTIEVEDVKADSTCQSNETYCPAERIVRAASCWSMDLQVATDYTQDFK